MSSTAAVTGVRPEVDTFLPPIDKPKGLMMKLAYYFTRRQFGKVLTPLKVHSARLPSAFGMFYSKVAQLDKKLVLPLETVKADAFALGAKTSDPLTMYLNDVCTIPSNLAGHPAVSVPFGSGDDGLPVGVQVLAPALGETVMFQVAAAIESVAPRMPAAPTVGSGASR